MPDDPQAAPGGPPDPSTNQARGSFGVGEPRRVETRSTGVKGRTFTDEIHESFASLGHPRAADQWTAEEARTFADEIQEFLADASLCRDPDEWTVQDVVNVLEIMGDRLTDSARLWRWPSCAPAMITGEKCSRMARSCLRRSPPRASRPHNGRRVTSITMTCRGSHQRRGRAGCRRRSRPSLTRTWKRSAAGSAR